MPTKKTATLKPIRPIKQTKFKRPNINLLATMTLLLLGLGLVLFQVQQSQEIRSRAAGDCEVNTAMLETTSQEQRMMTLINEYRTMQGRVPLSWDPNLNRPAAWMAKDMIVTKRINHTDTFGRTPEQRLIVCQVNTTGNFAENVNIGSAQADETFLYWQTLPTERTNMLNPLFASAAVALEVDANGQGYWVFLAQGPYVGNATGVPSPAPTDIPIVPEVPNPSAVPSPNCLGQCPTMPANITLVPTQGANPTPTLFVTPGNPEPTVPGGGNPTLTGTVAPTQDPNNPGNPGDPGDPDNPGNPGNPGEGPGKGNQGGIIGLFLAFLALIIQFFLSLIGRG